MTPQQLLPNVYSLGFKVGQTLSGFFTHDGGGAAPGDHHYPSLLEVLNFVTSFPGLYKEWWLNLVANDPVHVFVETTLIVSIIYILISSRRQKSWKAREAKLTPAEEEELLTEWRLTRASLVPAVPHSSSDAAAAAAAAGAESYSDDDGDGTDESLQQEIVVHKVEGRTMDVEVIGGDGSGNGGQLRTVLNLATFDFLGMSSNDESVRDVKDAARRALNKYGCGSCGPRGFYGTVDVHLQLEKYASEFCGSEGAILYSDGASMCSSTVASFAKRGDLIVADEAVYEPLRTGIALSRAHVKWFKHNDVDDLRKVLQSVRKKDRQLKRKSNQQRRFIVVEGLYKNSGTICPLDEIVKLKHEFCYRLILDESFSFGTLGETGRGVVELYGQKLMRDAEIVTVGLENAIGGIGGLTIGTEEVVDHQRLSGSGYCFSASSPPFTATAAMASIRLLEDKPEIFLQRLIDNRVYLYEKLKTWCEKSPVNGLLIVTSDERSPIVYFQVADVPETEYLDRVVFFAEVVRESLDRGAAFVATGQQHSSQTLGQHSLPPQLQGQSFGASGAAGAGRQQQASPQASSSPPPGLRMTVSAALTHADIDHALTALGEAVDAVMTRFREESK